MRTRKVSIHQANKTLEESVDGEVTQYDLSSERDISELTRVLKQELRNGAVVLLLGVISWD